LIHDTDFTVNNNSEVDLFPAYHPAGRAAQVIINLVWYLVWFGLLKCGMERRHWTLQNHHMRRVTLGYDGMGVSAALTWLSGQQLIRRATDSILL
jgi:hypothetical protein